MATITWFDGNRGFSGRFDLDHYLGAQEFTLGLTVLSFVHEAGTEVRPGDAAYRIEMTFRGIRTETDPKDGSTVVTGGLLHQVRFSATTAPRPCGFPGLAFRPHRPAHCWRTEPTRACST